MELSNMYRSTTGIVIEKIYNLEGDVGFYITPLFTVNDKLTTNPETRKYFSSIRVKSKASNTDAHHAKQADRVKTIVKELGYLQSHVEDDFRGITEVIYRTNEHDQGMLSNSSDQSPIPIIPHFDEDVISNCYFYNYYVLDPRDMPNTVSNTYLPNSQNRVGLYDHVDTDISHNVQSDLEDAAFDVLDEFTKSYCGHAKEKVANHLYESAMLINGKLFYNEIRGFSLDDLVTPTSDLLNIQPVFGSIWQ
jgi:hypothetical protein